MDRKIDAVAREAEMGGATRVFFAQASDPFVSLYVRTHQRWYGYIKKNVWHPGILRADDPRGVRHA